MKNRFRGRFKKVNLNCGNEMESHFPKTFLLIEVIKARKSKDILNTERIFSYVQQGRPKGNNLKEKNINYVKYIVFVTIYIFGAKGSAVNMRN